MKRFLNALKDVSMLSWEQNACAVFGAKLNMGDQVWVWLRYAGREYISRVWEGRGLSKVCSFVCGGRLYVMWLAAGAAFISGFNSEKKFFPEPGRMDISLKVYETERFARSSGDFLCNKLFVEEDGKLVLPAWALNSLNMGDMKDAFLPLSISAPTPGMPGKNPAPIGNINHNLNKRADMSAENLQGRGYPAEEVARLKFRLSEYSRAAGRRENEIARLQKQLSEKEEEIFRLTDMFRKKLSAVKAQKERRFYPGEDLSGFSAVQAAETESPAQNPVSKNEISGILMPSENPVSNENIAFSENTAFSAPGISEEAVDPLDTPEPTLENFQD
ncbi:MAG: hypothetical protein IJC39_05730 [Firmicutes bacterium]|nr:hypothetical protein [Bacillota bacterium]